ncbi:MAG: GNAT family protein [Chloroflexota bacterium]
MDKPTLVGDKVILRPISADKDADAMFAALSDEESMRLTGTQAEFTFEQVEAFCRRIETAEDRYDFAITEKNDGDSKYVGEVVLNDIDEDNRSASFRIALGNVQHFGKGLGTEATRLIVDFGFKQLNLHRIELEVFDFNPRAQHVYEKVGFKKEGVKRDVLLWEGKYQSAIVMSILEDEWSANAK